MAQSQPDGVWVDGSHLALIPSGPAIIGTLDEETLTAVQRDTPWYDVRRIEAARREPVVPAFLLGKFPVTCAQFASFLNDTGATRVGSDASVGGVVVATDVVAWLKTRRESEGPHAVGVFLDGESGWAPHRDSADLPMTLVTWFGADLYAKRFGARLPTELEWEKAARGEDGLRFPWGNDYEPGRANLADYWAGHAVNTQSDWDLKFSQEENGPAWLASRPTPSGSFRRGLSPYGVEDMIGNVAEWCDDVYDASSEGGRADFRAMRGAGRYGYLAIARCATRRRRAPESVGENLGFRIAVSPASRITSDGV